LRSSTISRLASETTMPTNRSIPTNRVPIYPGEVLLHEFRIPLGLTQEELAVALDIDRPAYSAIENGKRSITPRLAVKLKRVLRMPGSCGSRCRRTSISIAPDIAPTGGTLRDFGRLRLHRRYPRARPLERGDGAAERAVRLGNNFTWKPARGGLVSRRP